MRFPGAEAVRNPARRAPDRGRSLVVVGPPGVEVHASDEALAAPSLDAGAVPRVYANGALKGGPGGRRQNVALHSVRRAVRRFASYRAKTSHRPSAVAEMRRFAAQRRPPSPPLQRHAVAVSADAAKAQEPAAGCVQAPWRAGPPFPYLRWTG